ncbi:MAG TPA: acyl-ACP desaturase [Candidatus Eisenbacteria bacterium]|nr:acyl-ACP desaturase [Candidatus Eisenbacteria bacterium]
MSLEAIQKNVLDGMDEFVQEQLSLLKPVADCWQPSDFLPDMTSAGWREDVQRIRDGAAGLTDETLVVLVGNLVTEEALPSYQTWLNRIDEIRDVTGADDRPWALWSRRWTAEENRHGELLTKYLYLAGRVDMRSVEITTQNLIRNGFDLKSDNDAYQSLVYASFQERATKISHANTGYLVEKCGDQVLARICSAIASDEARHEEAYKRFFKEVARLDPSRAVIAFAAMMRKKVAMPARFMSDGVAADLFTQFAVTAQKSGVYTTRDYAEVVAHLLDYWGIPSMTGLFGAAAEARDYLCALPGHFLSKADKTRDLLSRLPAEPFSWIFGRTA